MNKPSIAALAALAALLGATAARADDTLPKRKPGLWDMAMQMDSMGGQQMKSQQCIDEKTDEAMQRRGMAGRDDKAECKQTSLKKVSGGVEYEAECKSAEGTARILARMSGDTNSSYTVDNTMTFTPPRHGMSQMHMVVKATYGGACPAGMKPGDIRVAGMTINPTAQPQGGPPAGIDVKKLQNMSPEERMKYLEEMKKSYGVKP